MFDLETAIADWRRTMLTAGIKAPVPLDELELHLREEIDAFITSGLQADQAFKTAMSRLGTPQLLQGEFQKDKPMPWRSLTVVSLVWIGLMILLAAQYYWRPFSKKLGLLLLTHIFSLTIGYLTAFLAGGFGICYVCFRLCHKLSPSRRQWLNRATVLFTQVSALLVAAGVLLGTIWTRRNLGSLFEANPTAIGAYGTLAWFLTAMFIQRFSRRNDEITILIALGGSIMVGLAWFGALAAGASGNHRMGNYLLFAVFIAVHVAFLTLAGVPGQTRRLKNSHP